MGLSQKNFLGTGNEVNINAQKSDDYTNVSFGYTDPYWTLDGISRGYNMFYRKVECAPADYVLWCLYAQMELLKRLVICISELHQRPLRSLVVVRSCY